MNEFEHESEPELRELLRRLLRGICLVAVIFSGLQAAVGLLSAGQIFEDEIPAGRVQSVVGETKAGNRIRLDNGYEVVFSNLVPMAIAAGDFVEKRRETCVYVVNGKARTDGAWVVRAVLLPAGVTVPLGVYLVLGSFYALNYRRAPLGDGAWFGDGTGKLRRSRGNARLIVWVLAGWLIVCFVVTLGLGCMSACLFRAGQSVVG